MYCPSCGAHFKNGLKYCKLCGYALSASTGTIESKIHPLALTAMFLAVAAIAGFGLMGLLIGSHELIERGMDSNRLIPTLLIVLGFGSLTVISVVALLIRFLSNLLGLPRMHHWHSRSMPPATTEHPPAQLTPPPYGVSSVTEHTTRNFDLAERQERQREKYTG